MTTDGPASSAGSFGPVSVAPQQGSGSHEIFQVVFDDPRGASDLAVVRLLLNAEQTAGGGCYVAVDVARAQIALADDAGENWSTAPFGGPGLIGNSQCRLDSSGSTMIAAGTSLTVNLDITFQAAFGGAKSIWANATDGNGNTSAAPRLGGYQVDAGTWQPAAPVSVSPWNGAGSAQTFIVNFSDAYGAADMAVLRVLINGPQSAQGGCYVSVDVRQRTLSLADDAGQTWATLALGAAGTLRNSQCGVRAETSSLTLNAATAALALDVTFAPAFAGLRSIWANLTDLRGDTSASPLLGAYTVTGAAATALGPESVSPSGGGGSAQAFTFSFTDGDGAADAAWLRVLFNSQQSATAGCYVAVDPHTLLIYLADDAGTGWAQARMGTADTVSNSQCLVRAASSTLAAGGTRLTLTLQIEFTSSFAGARSIWANITGGSGRTSGSPALGTYTVARGVEVASGPVAVSPASGSGTGQLFTVSYSNAAGAGGLATLRLLINDRQSAAGGCYLSVDVATRAATLADDQGGGGSAVTLGAPGLAQNSQCAVRGASSGLTLSGTTATLTLDIVFASGFTGTKSIWANQTGLDGVTSASPQLAVYTITGGATLLGPVSVTPNNGSGSAHTLLITYHDEKGAPDLAWLRVLVHSSQTAAAGCYVAVDPAARIVYLADDSGLFWTQAGLGGSGTLANSQCSVSAGASSVASYGNDASLTLAVSFRNAFAGVKSIWANATDRAGLTSASPLLGSLTVTADVADLFPHQVAALSASTAAWTYPIAPMPDWGGTYTDSLHTTGTAPVVLRRLPAIPGNCSSSNWSNGAAYRPNFSVTYGGAYYYVPYSAGVTSKARFTLNTTAAAAAGGRTLTFAATGKLDLSHGFQASGTNIPAGALVVSFDSTTVTLDQAVTGTGVAAGAVITFTNPPPLAPWVAATQEEACRVRSVVPSYSMRQAWNADESRFMVISAGGASAAYFYRNTSPPTFDFEYLDGGLSGTNGDETWSHTDPNKIAWMRNTVSPPQMVQLDVSTKQVTTVHTYDITGNECPAGTVFVNNGGSGNPSTDDRYWAQACSPANGIGRASRIIVYDKALNAVTSKRDITDICGTVQPIDWLGMSPSGKYVVVAWASTTPYEDTWTTCHGVELFDRQTLTSRGMVVSSDGHNDLGYDIHGNEILVAPHGSRLLTETANGNWSIDVTRLDEVHPPPYGTSTNTSYVRRYYLPCSFYSQQTGTDAYTGCTGPAANGLNFWHLSGRAAEFPANYGQFLLSTYAYAVNPGQQQTGWGRGENIALAVDATLPSQITLQTSAATTSGNVLHFASTTAPGGLYRLLAGGQLYAGGTRIADNTTVVSFDATSVTLSNNVTGTVGAGSTISFYVRQPFRRVSRTLSTRYGGTLPQCTGGDDYWQEAHSTVNRSFTQVLFASSWLTQCGQVGTFLVDLPGGPASLMSNGGLPAGPR